MTMCSIFNCDKRHGSYCCAECQERKECRNPCQNGPERCGHCGREIAYPFQCDCGYIGEPETIAYNISFDPSIVKIIKFDGFICCPKCRTVKFCPPAPGRK